MIILGLIVAGIGAAVSTIPPYILRRAIDDLNTQGVDINRLLLFGGLILATALVNGLFTFGQRQMINGASYRIEYELRQDLFGKLMDLDQDFYGANHTGDLMARATNDLSAVRQMLGPGITSIAGSGLTLVVAAIWMLKINGPLALL